MNERGDFDRQVIAIFEGPEVAFAWSADAPGVLLGLRPGGAVASDVVLGAMRGKLAELAAHPMAGSPQGEHMRRLIQNASSRMLLGDTVVPPRLPPINGGAAAASSVTRVIAPAPASAARLASSGASVAPSASVAPAVRVPIDPLVASARRVLAEHGGPTPRAMSEITMRLAAAGRPATEISAVIALAMAGDGPAAASGGNGNAAVAPQTHPRRSRAALESQHGGLHVGERASSERGDDADERSPRAGGELVARRPVDADPTARLLMGGLVIGGAVLALIVGGVFVLTTPFGGGAGSGAGGATAGVTAGAGAGAAAGGVTGEGSASDVPVAAPAPLVSEPMQTGSAVSAGDISRRLTAAAGRINDAKDEAIESAQSALVAAGSSWDSMSAGDRVAVGEAVVELVYRAAEDEATLREVLRMLESPVSLDEKSAQGITPSSIQPAAFSAGAFWRLSRERELPGVALEGVRLGLASVLGGARPSSAPGFASGMSEALRLIPLRIAQRSDTNDGRAVEAVLSRWVEVVRNVSPAEVPTPDASPVTGGPPSESDAIMVDALARLLLDGPDPAKSPAAHRAILGVSRALRWDGLDQSRGRLALWLGDARVSTPRLHLVTAAIVKLARVDGLDDSFVLPLGATGEQRAAIRDAYVSTWSLAGVGRSGAGTESWTQAVRMVLDEPGPDRGDDLTYAIMAAQFNQSAVLRASGRIDEGIEIASRLQPPAEVPFNPASQAPGLVGVGSLGDDSWAARYLCGDRSVAVRLQRVRELQDRAPQIAQLDADVLVEIAFAGSPPELSAAAMKAIPNFALSAQMTHALLKLISKAPRREAIGRLVEQMTFRTVPPVYSDRWAFAMRKALVERLIEQMASQTWAGRVDSAMVQMAEAYGGMVSITPVQTPEVEKASAELLRAVEQFGATLRTQASGLVPNQALGLSLDQIERRRQARRVVALGPIQVFAGEQVTLLELLSYIAASERPESVSTLLENLTQAGIARRKATSILAQLRVVEQGITRVWAERMGIMTQPWKGSVPEAPAGAATGAATGIQEGAGAAGTPGVPLTP